MSELVLNVEAIPPPVPTPLSQPYWDGTKLGELRFQRCDACGTANFGPSVACSNCRSCDLSWHVSGGRGTLYSWTVVWRAPTPQFAVPYAPAIIRLDEGYDMVSALAGIAPDHIEADLRVGVLFHPISPSITLPFFGPSQ